MKDIDLYIEYCSFSEAQSNERSMNGSATVGKGVQTSGKFDKGKLPSPIEILRMLNIKEGNVNQAGYWSLCCPFHKNGAETHASLNMHHQRGNYRCHACGAKGGDILKFYCEVTSKSFKEAAKELGAWGDK